MSASGHERTSRHVRVMPVISLKADINERDSHVQARRQASLAESGHCWLEGGGPSGLGCLLKGKGVAEQLAVLPRLAEEG
jgi:hypothetical protein